MGLECCYCKQVNSSCLSGSVWCLRGSEKTILVFEVSNLIKGEIIRASCSGWKSQTLHRALKGRAALRNSMLQRRKSHKKSLNSPCHHLLEKLNSKFDEERQKSNPAAQHAALQRERRPLLWDSHSTPDSHISSLGKVSGGRKLANVAV